MKLQDFQINHQHYIMKKAKPTLKNIIAYIQGNLRYKLFYSNFAFLIRPHIREQIEVRINSMDTQCYEEGQCKMCGCQTTHLQMADKACDKPCYPSMLSKEQWYVINKNCPVYDEETKFWWSLYLVKSKLNPLGVLEFHKIYKSDYIDDDSDNLPKRNWYAPKQSNEKFFNI